MNLVASDGGRLELGDTEFLLDAYSENIFRSISFVDNNFSGSKFVFPTESIPYAFFLKDNLPVDDENGQLLATAKTQKGFFQKATL